MQTFVQTSNQPQKPVSSNRTRPYLATPKQEKSEQPTLSWQNAISNQAKRLALQTNIGAPHVRSTDRALPCSGHDFSRIAIHPSGAKPRYLENERAEDISRIETSNAIIQRKPGEVDESAKKAELEFHSTIAFNNANSTSSSTGPSEEGFSFLQIKWTVWNSGWEIAPEHVDRMTIYRADRCSGCRDEKDEILRMEVTAPSTVPITQPGEGVFRYETITPMVGMTIRAGHYDIYVDLDVYDEVEEINEDNNTIFSTFFVKPRSKPEPSTEEE